MYALLGGAVGGALFVLSLAHLRHRRRPRPPIEALKNALLTLALMRARPEDRNELDTRYRGYDGTRLPMFAGCNLANACFTYIVDRSELRRDPWYTPSMEDKLDAIERYLARNLATEEQVARLFDDFLDTLQGAD